MVCDNCGVEICGKGVKVADKVCCDDCATWCVQCGAAEYRDDVQMYDDEAYCQGCFDRKFIVCEDCLETVPKRDCVSADNGCDYCPDCYGEKFMSCDNCGCEVETGDVACTDDGDVLCQSCYDEKYTRCAACECEILSDESFTSENGHGPYCQDCYNDRYFCCDDCGCETHVDHMVSRDSGCFCEDCGGGENWDAAGDVIGTTFDVIKSTRKFGVELETSDCRGYESTRGQHVFGAKDDGSIKGKEFVSPVLRGDEGLQAVSDFCNVAKCWEVDSDCGYHLHIDMGRETLDSLRSICLAYHYTMSLWRSFVPDARRHNHFCDTHPWDAYEIARSDFRYWAGRQNRYAWFNVASYGRHSTFEIRLHGGTLSERKITNWIKAHTRFADWAATRSEREVRSAFSGKTQTEQFDMLSEIWGDETLTEYYRARAAKFGTVYVAPVAV